VSEAAPSRTFASFRHRNFRLFFFGQGVSQVGNWLTLIGQALLVYHLTKSGVALGILSAAQFLPVLLFGAWAGVVADRTDKRTLIFVVQLFAMGQSFGLAAVALLHHPPVVAIYGLALIGGCCQAADNPARRSFVAEIVPAEDVQNSVSLNSAIMTGGRVVGPALGGLLVITMGYSWCFAVDGISYVAVLYALWRMDPMQIRRPVPPARAKGQIRAGIRYTRTNPELWVPIVMLAVIGTLAFNFNVVIQLLVEQTFHASDGMFTLMYSTLSFGSVIGCLVAARMRDLDQRDITRMAYGFGVSLLALAATPTLWLAMVFGVAVGFASLLMFTATTTILQLRADPLMRGRVLALQSIVVIGSNPIGGPLMGVIGEYVNARACVLVGAVATLGTALWTSVANPTAAAGRAEIAADTANVGAA
jgi:MFS family permease